MKAGTTENKGITVLELVKTHKAILGALAFLLVAGLFLAAPADAQADALIFIEPGHGGNTGAWGVLPTGHAEDEINLGIALKLDTLLRESNYATYLTRTDNTWPNPDWSNGYVENMHMDQANAMGADLFLSIHNNAISYQSASGTETWYYPVSGSYTFADAVQRNVVAAIRRTGWNVYDRGVNICNSDWMIARARMPAALVEGMFVSNPAEAALLMDPNIQQAIAQGLFDAIASVIPPPSSAQYPVVQWNAVPGAARYGVEFTDAPPENPNGTTASIHRVDAVLTSNTFHRWNVINRPAGTYWWRVIPFDGAGQPVTGFSDTQTIDVPEVALVGRINGRTLYGSNALFRWDPVWGATGYGVEVSNQNPENPNGKQASTSRIWAGSTTGNAIGYNLDGLQAGTYWYRVIAWNHHGWLAGFSDADSFTLTKVNVTNRINGAVVNTQFPAFQWDTVVGATSYGIELLAGPPENPNTRQASRNRLSAGLTSGTVWNGDIRGLAYGTYYYRVLAVGAGGYVASFSDADSFTIPKPLLNPMTWTDVNHPRFSWGALPTVTGYGIELLTAPPENPNGASSSRYRLAAGPTANTYWNGDATGLPGGTYYYRILAWNQYGLFGVFSDAASFAVVRPNMSPIAWPDPIHPRFAWSPVTGATSYDLEILLPNTAPAAPNGTEPDPNRMAAASVAGTTYDGDTSALAPGIYYVRVIARNAGGVVGTFSNPVTFTVGVMPSIRIGAGSGTYNIRDAANNLITTVSLVTTRVSSSGASSVIVVDDGRPALYTPSYVRFEPVGGTILDVVGMGEYNRFRGIIEVRYSNGQLWAINEVDMQSYLKGMGEEPEWWPGGDPTGTLGQYMEFLKVSAVAFRSYAFDVMVKKNKHPGEPFDLCNSPSSCQWYIGYARETHGPNLSTAVDATYGQVLNYGGQCARTPYFSECSGRTLSASEKGWNYPWCISKTDAGLCDGHVQRGHGVGMCMDGARRRAAYNWNYDQILHYYYTLDAGFGNVGNPNVRVGVFSTSG